MTASDLRADLVILIPGLWMPAWSMRPLASRLRGRGLRCVCFGYPSRSRSLEENADRLACYIRGKNDASVHLVGHSFGGVLALHTTASRPHVRVRSIVMMGSPAQGSDAAVRLSTRSWARRLIGRGVADWLSAPRPVAPENVAVGTIAGTRAFGLGMLFVPDLTRPHDGVVRVAETRVSGASDRVEVPVAHIALLTSRHVAALVAAFVLQGRFGAPAGTRGAVTRTACVTQRNPVNDGRGG